MTLYSVIAGCPACGQGILEAEETDGPIDYLYDIQLSAKYCSRCGTKVSKVGGWDIREVSKVQRTTNQAEEAK